MDKHNVDRRAQVPLGKTVQNMVDRKMGGRFGVQIFHERRVRETREQARLPAVSKTGIDWFGTVHAVAVSRRDPV